MSRTNAVARVLCAAWPIVCFLYLLSVPPVDATHIRYGTGTFPLALMAGCLLVAAALDEPGDDYGSAMAVFMVFGAAGFAAIFVYAFAAGLPLVPA